MNGYETLQHLETVDGYEICHMDRIKEKHPSLFNDGGQMDWKKFESEIRPNYHVFTRKDKSSLTFTMMNKPVKEGGKGVQLTTLIVAAKSILEKFDELFPCEENKVTIKHLEEALLWQEKRTQRRIADGNEGRSRERTDLMK